MVNERILQLSIYCILNLLIFDALTNTKIGMILRIINPKINTDVNKKQIDLFKLSFKEKQKTLKSNVFPRIESEDTYEIVIDR